MQPDTTMTNETRLREALEPCPNPWCEASEPMVTNAPDFRMPPWACHCDNCGIEAPARENEAEAIRAWNTRAALSLPDQPTVDAGGEGLVCFYIDCEFDGHNGPLLSIALVEEGGRSVHIEADVQAHDPWVKANVVPLMEEHDATDCTRVHPHEVGNAIRWFLGDCERPVIIADSPVDIGRFCQAISTGSDGGWASADYPQMTFEVHNVDCYPTDLPGAVQHNAWWDAMALRHKLARLTHPVSPVDQVGEDRVEAVADSGLADELERAINEVRAARDSREDDDGELKRLARFVVTNRDRILSALRANPTAPSCCERTREAAAKVCDIYYANAATYKPGVNDARAHAKSLAKRIRTMPLPTQEPADRWQMHWGGPCPLPAGTPVEIETYDGARSIWQKAEAVIWERGTYVYDIGCRLPRAAEVIRYRTLPTPPADKSEPQP